MLEDGAHKEILEDDYERHRQLAEKFRERKEPAKAAEHYRKTAEIVDQIADLESAEKLAEKRRSLAKNLDEAADTLEAIASGEVSVVDGESETTAEFSDDRSGTQSGGPEPGGTANASPPGGTGNGDENKEVDAKAYLKDPPELDFDDVGGMTDLKQTVIDTIVDPLERPDLYEEYGLGVVNGVLLYGPPGTGKTYITQALAGKLGYNFIEVTPSDLSSSLVGEAADNVAELFTVARENQPCLVFIDEIDAIAGQRTGGAQTTQSQQQMVNQLLTELSDVQGEDVVVFAATNLLEAVDDAIKRSGRFDERIEVPPPDETAREAILRVHLRDRPVLTETIDWDEIVGLTEGYAASDLELVATTAARDALKEARDESEIQPVTQHHLTAAVESVDSSLADWDE